MAILRKKRYDDADATAADPGRLRRVAGAVSAWRRETSGGASTW